MRRTISVMILTLIPILAVANPAGAVEGAGAAGDIQFVQLMDQSSGPHASIFLRTNEVGYLTQSDDPRNQIMVRVDLDPNGHMYDKTYFVSFLNKETGESRYLDVTGGRPRDASDGVVDFEGNPPAEANAYPIPALAAPLNTLVGPAPAPVSTLDPSDLGAGRWAAVFDIRDVTGTRISQRAYWHFVIAEQATELPAEINADMTLDWRTLWILPSRLHTVGPGATLTIEPGTVLLGTDIATLIGRGGRIHAEGTALSPIIMTSDESVGSRRVQGWGGLVLAGNAPINGCEGGNCEGDVEGVSNAKYGGNDPADDSGVLKYVRVEFAGAEFSPENELNGIAFHGIGNQTEVDYVQVHYNKDDGIEMFGGTANIRHALLTGVADDSLDYPEGWVGKAQFICIQQDKSDADNGFEFDSNGEANDLLPRSNPTISNVTLVGGNPGAGSDAESDIGMLVREGTAGQTYNSIVIGFGREAVVIDQAATTRQINSGDLVIANNIFGPNRTRESQRVQFAAGSDAGGYGVDAWIRGASPMNRFADSASAVGLADPFNALSPDFRPLPNSMALDVNYVKTLPEDGFFTPVTYAGCVGPNDDWIHSWSTSEPSLASGN